MYLELKKRSRIRAVQKLIGGKTCKAHCEVKSNRSTRSQARDYCQKEDSRVDGPWEVGTFAPEAQGKRTDLHAVADDVNLGKNILAIAQAHPVPFIKYAKGIMNLIDIRSKHMNEAREIYIAYGPPGIGKSWFARRHSSPDLWVKPTGSGGWFDGYYGQEEALFDEFRGSDTGIKFPDLLQVIDRYSSRVPVKGGHAFWHPKVIWFTCNLHPLKWYPYRSDAAELEALQRRITRVYHWRQGAQDPMVLDPAGRPDLWKLWWNGPSRDPVPQLGPFDLWKERRAEHEYDFMPAEESEPTVYAIDSGDDSTSS